jgi:hypothetical protein
MAIATARTTLGSLFGVVATSANTVTSVLDAAQQGVGMAAAYVEKAASEQRERHALDKVDFTTNLIQERSQMAAARKVEVAKFRSQSKEHAAYYDESAALYLAALRPADTK